MKILLSLLMLCAFHFKVLHAQALETEESKPLLPGQVELGTGLEYQTSTEGTETALPLAIEYGIAKRLTLLIEPVAFTTPSASGQRPSCLHRAVLATPASLQSGRAHPSGRWLHA